MEDILHSKPPEFVSPVSSPVKPARSSHFTLNPIVITEEKPVTASPQKHSKKFILPPMEKGGSDGEKSSVRSHNLKDALRESRAGHEEAIKVVKSHILSKDEEMKENRRRRQRKRGR